MNIANSYSSFRRSFPLYFFLAVLGLVASCSGESDGPTPAYQVGNFTDDRDGQEYQYVIIGSQTWMAENLNYETPLSSCYDNDPANCTTYGRLYDWWDAIDACPEGWHLPTLEEYQVLIDRFGGVEQAGASLKATTGWDAPNTGANDLSRFSALPGGSLVQNLFERLGQEGEYWTATPLTTNSAAFVRLHFNSTQVETTLQKSLNLGGSCRCVKD
ncbi:fibrobacter succinogenes major paralogous domain-containing protein [Lunatimonas salinarum]|uniref:fibrobacter succinogenes major paralogous domain-containing protein n=1 Tax=Lunatimonas salinarum TaxID=1774590 RepID=UPI001AE0AF93|nr:fibrobacter succinogenes major paralogous domain-containing protein [Lunatimonas salinarum]